MSFFNRKYFFSAGAFSEETEKVIRQLVNGNNAGSFSGSGPWHPPADLIETADGLLARFELAGVAQEDIEIRVVSHTLHLRGVRRDCCRREKKCYRQMEIHCGGFERSLRLPCPVNPAEAEATLHNGLLEVYLPRAEKQPARMMAIEIVL